MEVEFQRSPIDEKRAIRLARAILLLVISLVFATLASTLELQSLSFDEGLSILFAQKSLPSMLNTLVREDLHPPLHYLVLHFWMMAAGRKEFTVRFISLFCAVLLPPLTFALVREIYATDRGTKGHDLAVALPAAVLSGSSPFLTYYFQEARMYALLLLLTLTATLALLRATRLGGRKEWLIYSLFLSLSFYTHYSALFMVPAFFLFACLKGQEYLKRWLKFTALALMAFSPWLRPAYLQMRRLSEHPDYWPSRLSPMMVLRAFMEKISPYAPQGVALGLAASIVVLILAVLIRERSDIAAGEVLAVLNWIVPLALTSLLMSLVPKFGTRYLIISTVPFYISVVIGLARLLWRRSFPLRLLFILILASAALLSWKASSAVISGERNPRDDVRAVARYLNRKARADDAILLVENAYHSFIYYYHGEAPWYGLHVGEDFAHGAKVLNEILSSRPRRIWLVLWHHEFADPTDMVITELMRVGREVHLHKEFQGYKLKAFDIEDYDHEITAYPEPQTALSVSFGQVIRLLGFDVIGQDEGVRHYILYWEAEKHPKSDYVLSLTLVDEAGNEYLKVDDTLCTWYYLPKGWPLHVPLRGRVDVALPCDLPDIPYRVRLGVFDPSSGEYLGVWGREGRPQGRDVLLERIRIAKDRLGNFLPEIPYVLNLSFKGELELMGYDVASTELRQGDELRLTLWWRAMNKMAHNRRCEVRLVDGEGRIAFSSERPIVDGYPTSRWTSGEIDRAVYRLALPTTLPSGEYELQVGVNGEFATLTKLTVLERQRSYAIPSMQRRLDVDFGGEVTLLGCDFSAEEVREGQTLAVTLYWQAQKRMQTSYKVTVQLLTEDMQLVGQDDSVPVDWTYPTTAWAPREVVADEHKLRIGPGAKPGRYLVIVALYEEHTGRRLIALQNGERKDHATLGFIQIVP